MAMLRAAPSNRESTNGIGQSYAIGILVKNLKSHLRACCRSSDPICSVEADRRARSGGTQLVVWTDVIASAGVENPLRRAFLPALGWRCLEACWSSSFPPPRLMSVMREAAFVAKLASSGDESSARLVD